MLFHLTQNKCPLCSQLSSQFKELVDKVLGRSNKCQKLHSDTYDNDQRVLVINKTAPDCSCEKYRMSKHSKHPVQDVEMVARFVFSPMFVDKKGKVKSNIFGHVFTIGCSIQRENLATDQEILNLTSVTIDKKSENSWSGTLFADCVKLRKIMVSNTNNRAVCVYDTAENENPAHGEIGQSQLLKLDEDDIVELRGKLFEAFSNGVPVKPEQYRGGRIWQTLPKSLQR